MQIVNIHKKAVWWNWRWVTYLQVVAASVDYIIEGTTPALKSLHPSSLAQRVEQNTQQDVFLWTECNTTSIFRF